MNQMTEDDWVDFEYDAPDRPGRYLVVQKLGKNKKYRWVRYWNGDSWEMPCEDKYGPITHWCEMPAYPM